MATHPTFGAFNQGLTPTIACFNKAITGLGVDFDDLIAAMQVYVDKFVAPVREQLAAAWSRLRDSRKVLGRWCFSTTPISPAPWHTTT